ncbi:PQQ-binding-like beta-propeller repeat protein [Pontiella desulfatans]|nr:PQQ-binding-like beta-propeller repeat protein [Pontiella desulfatans]
MSIRILITLMAMATVAQADWPRFLGAGCDGKSSEAGLETDLSKVEVAWVHPRGESYSAPSILGDRLIHHGRFGDVERIECLDTATGKPLWADEVPTTYRDRFNYLSGPRASPSIEGGRVYTLGAQGILCCHQLTDGKRLWRRKLIEEFKLDTEFFGFTPSPLIEGDSVIINLGMGKCVAAFDKMTGKTQWVSGDQWGRSYASPVAATMHGQRVLLVFAGGESNPPVGGLLCIDPSSGKIHDRFAWRSPRHASVNASTPVVDGNRIFISSSYDVGGVMLEVLPDFTFKEVYRTKAYASHWATPILVDGHLYGFANNKLVCMDWKTGERVWRVVPKVGDAAFESPETGTYGASKYRPPPGEGGFGIGSLVHADGRFLCLGENGLLAWMKLTPEGCTILSSRRLFKADQTWTAPVLGDGRAYICQNLPGNGIEPGLICIVLKPIRQEQSDGK